MVRRSVSMTETIGREEVHRSEQTKAIFLYYYTHICWHLFVRMPIKFLNETFFFIYSLLSLHSFISSCVLFSHKNHHFRFKRKIVKWDWMGSIIKHKVYTHTTTGNGIYAFYCRKHTHIYSDNNVKRSTV